MSWEPWDSGSIPSLAQWLKDLVLPQLQLRSQLWLEFDPCPGNPRVAKKKKKAGRQYFLSFGREHGHGMGKPVLILKLKRFVSGSQGPHLALRKGTAPMVQPQARCWASVLS